MIRAKVGQLRSNNRTRIRIVAESSEGILTVEYLGESKLTAKLYRRYVETQYSKVIYNNKLYRILND